MFVVLNPTSSVSSSYIMTCGGTNCCIDLSTVVLPGTTLEEMEHKNF